MLMKIKQVWKRFCGVQYPKPVPGELVVVSHWGDFDYPMDAVQLGRLREIKQDNRSTYYCVDDSNRGFRHCRTLNPRVLPNSD